MQWQISLYCCLGKSIPILIAKMLLSLHGQQLGGTGVCLCACTGVENMSSFGIQAECSLHFSVCDLVAFSEAETSYHSLNCLVFRLLFTKVFVLTEACGSNLSAFVLFLFTELATIQAVCLIMWNSLQWQSSLLLLQSGHTCLQLHGYFTCLITSFFLDENKS